MAREVCVLNFIVFAGLICCIGVDAQQPERGVVAASADATPRRIALVIGNADYPGQPLHNPVNDANDVGALLSGTLGFETEIVRNADLQTFDSAVHRFAGKLSAGDVGLFYFSGHGLEVDGENYLLPVNFAAESRADIKYQAFPANEILDLMRDRGVRLRVLILDACRNNPYRSLRGVDGGLAGMTEKGAFIAFAAAAGKTADDNPSERNGLFAKYLLQELTEPGLNIDEVFDRVRVGVYQASHEKQWPFSYSGVIGAFRFRSGSLPAALGQPSQPTPASSAKTPSAAPSAAAPPAEQLAEQGNADVARFYVLHFNHFHTCSGVLTVERHRLRYEPRKGKDGFNVPLSDIVWAREGIEVFKPTVKILLQDGRKYTFDPGTSSTIRAIVVAIRRAQGGS